MNCPYCNNEMEKGLIHIINSPINKNLTICKVLLRNCEVNMVVFKNFF